MAGRFVKTIDHGYDALMARMRVAAGKVTVGIHEAEGSEPEGDSGATVAEVAAIQEMHGRSFVRPYADQNESALQSALRDAGQALVRGDVQSVTEALDAFGAKAASGMREFVLNGGVTKADEPETVERKGGSTPLVETGNLASKISHKVGK